MAGGDAWAAAEGGGRALAAVVEVGTLLTVTMAVTCEMAASVPFCAASTTDWTVLAVSAAHSANVALQIPLLALKPTVTVGGSGGGEGGGPSAGGGDEMDVGGVIQGAAGAASGGGRGSAVGTGGGCEGGGPGGVGLLG